MTIKDILKNSCKYIPIIGFPELFNPEKEHSFLETIGALIYHGIPAAFLIAYTVQTLETGKLSLNAQYQERQERKELTEKLFGQNGLADTNHDGKISIEEKARAFGIMGLERQVIFPSPNSEQLSKAVSAYEGEK